MTCVVQLVKPSDTQSVCHGIEIHPHHKNRSYKLFRSDLI